TRRSSDLRDRYSSSGRRNTPDHRHSAVSLRSGLADGEGSTAHRLHCAGHPGLSRWAASRPEDRLLAVGAGDLPLHHLRGGHSPPAGNLQRSDLTSPPLQSLIVAPSPDISHWRGLRVFGRSAVSRRFPGRRDRRRLWRLVRMAMFPALWKVRRKAAAYAAALVNRAWARAHSACQG